MGLLVATLATLKPYRKATNGFTALGSGSYGLSSRCRPAPPVELGVIAEGDDPFPPAPTHRAHRYRRWHRVAHLVAPGPHRLAPAYIERAVIGFTGALYVVPSVALLALVAPLTGYFSVTTAEVALVSYTLLILVRNIVTGLDSVPVEAHEVAQGMGYTPLGELLKVRLPLAMPSVMGGLRVATVTVVGLVNVTAFIGQGGLGQLIIQQGFQEDFNTPIFVGLVLSIMLAGAADALIVLLQWASLPWLRARG